jgi:hypothetical protein
MKTKLIYPILSFFILGLTSCSKPDSEILGCVFGKIKGDKTNIRIGCMNKARFDAYVKSPSFEINGKLVDQDLQFRKIKDCLECN